MDPNATWAQMMDLAEMILKGAEESNDGFGPEDAVALAERVEALNTWIMKGGFLPKAWERK